MSPPGANRKENKLKRSSFDTITSGSTDITQVSDDKNRIALQQLETVIEQDSPLAYVIFSKEESDDLLEMTLAEIESKLELKFYLNSETYLKDAVILDYYTEAVQWCQQQKYKPQQLSILFTIVYNLLKRIEDEQASLVSLVSEFYQLLFYKGTDLRTINEKHFSIQQAKAIIDYVSTRLFAHYNLYLYVMTNPQDEKITVDDLSVEVPLANHAPLDEGLSDEILSNCFTMETPVKIISQSDGETEVLPDTEIDLLSSTGDIFGLLTHDDVQTVINEVCGTILAKLQANTEDKINIQGINSMAKISKVPVVQA